jgi:excinuclease UvrABC helicase subunit UvrB
VLRLEEEMKTAAKELRYEEAALLRDEIADLRLALAEESEGTPNPALIP